MMNHIGRFVRRHGPWLLLFCLLVTIPLLYVASKLRVELDAADLFPADDKYLAEYTYFSENFGVSDILVFVARRDAAVPREKLKALMKWLRRSPHFTSVEQHGLPGADWDAVILAFTSRPSTDQAFCRAMIADVRRYLEETQTAVELSGSAAIATEGTAALERDIRRTGMLAFGLIVLVLIVWVGDPIFPLVASLPLAMGLVWTFAFTQAVFGRLYLLSAGLPASLLGIGIDYALHLREARREFAGEQPLVAWGGVFRRIGPPLVISAMTTAAACLALGVARLQGLAQIGYIAGVGIVTIFLATVLVMPVLLDWRDKLGCRIRPLSTIWLERLVRAVRRHRLKTISCFLLVTLFLFVAALRIRIQTDPRSYQDPSLPSQQLSKELSNKMKMTFDPILIATPSLQAERRVIHKIAPFIGNDRPFNHIESLSKQFERLVQTPQLKRFVGKDRRLCTVLYPREYPYEGDNLSKLTAATDAILERCGDDIAARSGGPILCQWLIVLMKQDLLSTGILAGLIVVVMLAFLIRRRGYFLVTVTPLAGGIIWMLGIIHLVGHDLTLGSASAMPLVIGLGIDYGVHIVHRLRSGSVESAVATTGRAILVSALTTSGAFFTLCAAGNRGLVGIGLTAGTGILACLIWSLLFLPALLGPGHVRRTDHN